MKQQTLPIPVHLLLLDMLGVALVGFGLFELLGGQDSVLPAFMADPLMPWVMIGSGFLFMLPMVAHVIGMARRRSR
jgi:hypothetical protein